MKVCEMVHHAGYFLRCKTVIPLISGIFPYFENISNMSKIVSSDTQTLRSGLKKQSTAEFF